ncbi:hypothetical protein J0H58_09710, partial [bacterium]|nr:hypothetical protein [bacterium]
MVSIPPDGEGRKPRKRTVTEPSPPESNHAPATGTPAAPAVDVTKPTNWAEVAAGYAANLATHRDASAGILGIPAEAIDRLPGVGFNPADGNEPCATLPVVNAPGAVVGIARLFRDGSQFMAKGSSQGLYLPAGWDGEPGTTLVVTGPAAAACLTAAGLSAVGWPATLGGADLLAKVMRKADRRFLVVGDVPGAARVALANRVKRDIPSVPVPDGAADVRAWLTAAERIGKPWPDRGRELVARLLPPAVVTEGVVGPVAPAGGDGSDRPAIVIGPDEHRVNDEASAALTAEPDVYQRGG